MQHARSVSLALALSLCAPAALAQTVWTVDDDGGADFSEVQEAVRAAADGDVILVRDGSYGPVAITAKSLVIQVEQGGNATLATTFFNPGVTLSIGALAPGQSVRVRGLEVFKIGAYEYDAVDVGNNAGPVVLEDVTIRGFTPFGRPLNLRDNRSVTLVRCEVTAGPPQVSTCCGGLFLGAQSFSGVESIETNLFVYDSVITGGQGWNSYEDGIGPGAGRAAVTLRGGSLLASGCVLTGGPAGITGGLFGGADCHAGADGGPAIDVAGWTSGTAEALLIDNVLVSGASGEGNCGLPPGVVPPAIADPDGVVQTIPFDARSCSLDSPVEGALNVTAEFTGIPGELAVLVLGTPANGLLVVPPAGLAAHLLPPFALDFAGVLPASGTLVKNYAFPASATPFVVTAQGAFLPPIGTFASGPSTLVATGG